MSFGNFTKQNPFANGGFNSFNQPQLNNAFNANNIIQNFGFNDTQSMITQCCYHPQHSYTVFQSINQLIYTYPQLVPTILSPSSSFHNKPLMQLQGAIKVNFHGDMMAVTINITFPQKYPQQPPHIRIINTHPETTQTTPHYLMFESGNQPYSYLISSMLLSVEKWNHNSNIVDVVREAESLMGKKFPFKKMKAGKGMNSSVKHGGGSGIGNNNGFSGSGYTPDNQNQGFNNNQDFNNNQGFNKNQGFNNQGFNSGNNGQGFNNNNGGGNWDWDNKNNSNNNGNNNNSNGSNGGWNNWNNTPTNNNNNPNTNNNTNWNNTDTNNNGFNSNFSNKNKANNQHQSPPQPAKLSQAQQTAKAQLQDYSVRCTNFALESKKMATKLLAQRSLSLQDIQQLQPIVLNLNIQKQSLQYKTKSMIKFIKQNQNTEEINIKKLLTPKDDMSSQLLELVSINMAASDSLDEIEKYFSDGKIKLEQLLKLTRKIEEEKFMSKVMIKKKLEKQM